MLVFCHGTILGLKITILVQKSPFLEAQTQFFHGKAILGLKIVILGLKIIHFGAHRPGRRRFWG